MKVHIKGCSTIIAKPAIIVKLMTSLGTVWIPDGYNMTDTAAREILANLERHGTIIIEEDN